MADNKSLTADLACMRPIVDVRRRFGLSLSCVAGATARMFLDQEPHFGLHKRKRSRQHCVSTGAGDFFIPNSYTRGPLIIRSAAFFIYSEFPSSLMFQFRRPVRAATASAVPRRRSGP